MTADRDGQKGQEVFFILIRTSCFYCWTGRVMLQPSLTYLAFYPATEIQRVLSELANLLPPKSHLCFSFYIYPDLSLPQSHLSLGSGRYGNSSAKPALLSLCRHDFFFLLYRLPHGTLMRTDSQSPSDCIICKHINFPNRYRPIGGSDKVLSLYMSQHTLSQWELFNYGLLARSPPATSLPPFLPSSLLPHL